MIQRITDILDKPLYMLTLYDLALLTVTFMVVAFAFVALKALFIKN